MADQPLTAILLFAAATGFILAVPFTLLTVGLPKRKRARHALVAFPIIGVVLSLLSLLLFEF